MHKRVIPSVLAFCVAAWNGLPFTGATAALASELSQTVRTHEIGVQAYIYAYPMILMELTRRVSTNVPAPAGDFNLVIRLYWPQTEVLTADWNPPPVRRTR